MIRTARSTQRHMKEGQKEAYHEQNGKSRRSRKERRKYRKAAAEAEASRNWHKRKQNVSSRSAQLEEEELAVQKRLEWKRKQQELAEEEEYTGQIDQCSNNFETRMERTVGVKGETT